MWRRREASNGEMRMSRCTPASPLRCPYAYSPVSSMVADLIPASSPTSRSTTSALKPARSAQRRYMRMSIWAQSCDSVPPAPGWMERIAFLRSSGRERMTFSSKASSSSPMRLRLSWISAVMLSSEASVAISQSSRVSSARPAISLKVPTVLARSARSCTRACAFRLSSQNDGEAISVSIRLRRVSLAGTSKMPPEVVQTLVQLRHVALELA